MLKFLELKIPPVMVSLATLMMMWGCAHWLPEWSFELPLARSLALFFWSAGGAVAGAGIRAFRRARTTVHPMRPEKASCLVTGGLYRFTRNPMYLGLALTLTGFFFWLGNLLGAVFVINFVVYMTRFQIQPEERALEELFGQEFQEYAGRVRRWL